MQKVLNFEGVYLAKFGFCQLSMTKPVAQGEGLPAKKRMISKAKHSTDLLVVYQGNASLVEYCNAFKLRYGAFEVPADLHINNVGLTRHVTTHASRQQKFIDDIYLKDDGDKTQLQRLFALVMRTTEQHMQPLDEAGGHILLDENADYAAGTSIEYLTDCNGDRYIY